MLDQREPVVYVVQEPTTFTRDGVTQTKDLSSAQRYGVIKNILGQSESASLAPGPCLNKINREIKDFRPDKDYVCAVGGDPMSLALVLLSLRNMGFREIPYLRWERERNTEGSRMSGGFYVPVTILTW